jgi:hypothetical protein
VQGRQRVRTGGVSARLTRRATGDPYGVRKTTDGAARTPAATVLPSKSQSGPAEATVCQTRRLCGYGLRFAHQQQGPHAVGRAWTGRLQTGPELLGARAL